MSNINRDYLVILNPKTSKVTVPELNYYIYDKYTANLFVNLVTTEGGKVVNLPDADQYKLVLHVLKPTNEIQTVENIQVFNKEKALFQIELDQELTKNIGRYKCELLTVDKTDHITQSVKFSYRVKKSIYNDLDVVTETPEYPIIIRLLDKLQDIDKYEEERRANEVARVAAEKARVKDYTDLRQTVTTDINTMQEKIDGFDGKVQEVDNAVQQMKTNINKYQTEKNKELDNYKTQKDAQINTAITDMETTIDTYKTEKDTQINDKFNQQDTKIDSAINLQNKNIQASTKALNDKLDAAVEEQNNTIAANNQAQNKVINDAITEQNKTINTVVENDKAQDGKLDALGQYSATCMKDIKKLQDKDVAHEERMTVIEAVNVEQNNRLDAIEIKNDQQDSRLNNVEAKNKKQDLDLKCLFAESHSERITLDDEVGNSVFLQNSKQGFATVDELKGNTLVNCNKDTDKELILNGNIDTSGYTSVTTTEGVDGGKVDVALEGNTMVNVCDQEETVAITKSYTVETGNHIALQGEYDGKCRPNIYGNTMVNLVSNSNLWEVGCSGDVNTDYTITSTNAQDIVINKLTDNIDYLYFRKRIDPSLFKPNTTYTIIFNCSKAYRVGVISGNTAETILPLSPCNDGYNAITLASTDLSTITGKNVIYAYLGVNKSYIGTAKASNVIVLEGDYTNKPIPDYFTGMKSSFEDKLITDENDANNGKYKVDYKVTGKNIFDKSIEMLDGYYINDENGTNSVMTGYCVSKDYIRIQPNTTYYGSNMNHIGVYDKDKNFIRRFALWDSQKTFTTPSNAYYIRYQFGSNDSLNNVQLEEGTTATTYEPYKESIKTLYLNSPLLEGDTIEQSGNNIIHNHRYGKVVLDGSESWKLHNNIASWFYFDELDFKINNDNNVCIADRYKSIKYSDVGNIKDKTICMGSSDNSVRRTIIKDTVATTVADFRKYLQQNPITVVYELATPTQEIISSNDNLLLDSYTNGHLDVDSVVPIDKVEFAQLEKELTYLNVSTEYTIQFISDKATTADITLGGKQLLTQNITAGLNKINITTPVTLTDNKLIISGVGAEIKQVVVTPKVDNDFGYFKGMKSVGECEDNKIEILSRNKNILPIEELKKYIGNGLISEGLTINVVNDKIIINGTSNTVWDFRSINISWTPKFFKFINSLPIGTSIRLNNNLGFNNYWAVTRNGKVIYLGNTITIQQEDSNINSFVRIPQGYSFENNQELQLQIEFGTNVTNYVTPKIDKKEILLSEPLRGIPNGVKDKYTMIDGKWYIERNCICEIFDGSEDENWVLSGNNSNRVNGLTFRIKRNTPGSTGSSICTMLKCDKLKNITPKEAWGSNSDNMEVDDSFSGIATGTKAGDGIDIRIPRKILPAESVLRFKQWLSTNPVTVVYQLAQPTYEPIDYNPFEVYTDITHISNNSTIPCNMVIRNSGFNCILKPNTTYTVSSNNGLSTVTTKDSIGDSVLRFYDKDTTSVNTMKNVLVLEGDYVTGNPPIPAFFKGMESAFEQELVTDENDKNYGKYKVNVKATNPDNSQENNITFYINEPLRGVGDIKDKVYVKEDKVVVERNCSSVTFDENTNIQSGYVSPGIHSRKMNFIVDKKVYTDGSIETLPKIICPKLITKNLNLWANIDDQGCISVNQEGNIAVRLPSMYGSTPKEVKSNLGINPIKVVYQLATPTYEEVEYFDLKLFVEIFKDTTINYNSNIPVTSTINYTYSTPLTDAVNTVSDISDQQDSMIIDMATQVATMQMMLM